MPIRRRCRSVCAQARCKSSEGRGGKMPASAARLRTSRMPMPAEHANAQANGSAMDQAQCLQALRRAETAPGHSFVALKWFRDSYLPRQGFAWAESQESRGWGFPRIKVQGESGTEILRKMRDGRY